MDRDHSHSHLDLHSKNIASAFFLNLTFTVIEIFGGLMTNSLSVLSDAVHDLGDSLALGLAWYFQNVSKKGRDQKFTYGYRRFSLLGAIINSVVLVSGSILIVINAYPRLLEPVAPQTTGMFFLAILGIGFNSLAYFRMRGGHSHNERLVSLHLLEDVLGWVAILIGSLIMKFTGWFIIDPILSLAIATFILYNVIKNIRTSWKILLQGIPDHIRIKEIEQELQTIDSVLSVHDLHIWSLDGEKCILTVHLVVPPGLHSLDYRKIKDDLNHRMSIHNIDHCTIEIETTEEDCHRRAD